MSKMQAGSRGRREEGSKWTLDGISRQSQAALLTASIYPQNISAPTPVGQLPVSSVSHTTKILPWEMHPGLCEQLSTGGRAERGALTYTLVKFLSADS